MISKAIHQASCDGTTTASLGRERCTSGESFTAPEERMSLFELTACFVLSRRGWKARGGRIFCPRCAESIGCEVRKTTEGHA